MGRRRQNIRRESGVESKGGRIVSEQWCKDAMKAKGVTGDGIDGRGCDDTEDGHARDKPGNQPA
jgi:hypothetical protein